MSWISAAQQKPSDGQTYFLKIDNLDYEIGSYYSDGNNFYLQTSGIIESERVWWLDESEGTHTPDNTFRAEVAKGVLAALLSREWSDMDLACEQAVKAADKLIQKLNKQQ